MKNENDLTTIWKQKQKGIDYLSQLNLFEKTDENFRMFEGDQWSNAKTGGESLPFYNIIAPIVKYKVATVAQNLMTINYSSKGNEGICKLLNINASKLWERLKLDKYSWDYIKEACIAGDCYVYFYGKDIKMEQIDNVNILFADEQQKDIQKQPYILISQRRSIEDIKKEAEENKIDKDKISLILPDTETEHEAGDSAKQEVDDSKKCTSVLKLWKENGNVCISRSTKHVEYQPKTIIKGMTLYPIAYLGWDSKKGSTRSIGAVEPIIPNQIEINKGLARLTLIVKKFAYPMMAYNSDAVENPDNIDKIGAAIAVSGPNVQNIENVIRYVQPANISPFAQGIVDNLETKTRELSGAGDAVTGQVNPEKATGAAIIAVRDAAALPLNSNVANFKQFIEDIALIWLDMQIAYNPNGIEIPLDDIEVEGQMIARPPQILSVDQLNAIEIDVRIDVSPTNPYSKFTQEQSLENLLAKEKITFEEYVEALDEDSTTPKAKLQDIIKKRTAIEAQLQAQLQAQQGLPPPNMQLPDEMYNNMQSNPQLPDNMQLPPEGVI